MQLLLWFAALVCLKILFVVRLVSALHILEREEYMEGLNISAIGSTQH